MIKLFLHIHRIHNQFIIQIQVMEDPLLPHQFRQHQQVIHLQPYHYKGIQIDIADIYIYTYILLNSTLTFHLRFQTTMCRYPLLTFVNTPTGEFPTVATKVLQQTVRKNATNCTHALDTVQTTLIVIYFLRTGRVHLDGVREQIALPQTTTSQYLVQHTLVTIATEKVGCMKSVKTYRNRKEIFQ